MMLPEGDNRYTAIPILNPISEEFPYMRTTLVPAVIEAAKRNIAQQNKDLWLFETANVYEPKSLPLTEVPHERPMACGIMMGKVTEAAWNQAQRDTDFYDVKGVVDGLLAKLGLTQYNIQPSSESYYHPGVSAHYTVNGVTIANYGELHPQVVKTSICLVKCICLKSIWKLFYPLQYRHLDINHSVNSQVQVVTWLL